MERWPNHRRLLLLTDGNLGIHTAKTAAVLLRYRPDDVVAVLDNARAGQDVRQHIAGAPPVPILADVAAALPLAPDAICIGVAPAGGALNAGLRRHVIAALSAGLDVVSGLHDFLGEDVELAALARQHGAQLFDLRRPPAQRVLATGRARATRCRRVLTIGSDGNVGKMVAAYELTRAARAHGLNARFLATGQTGMLLAGGGVCIDACVADFAAGAAEELVLAATDADVVFIEGQGSLGHPGFSPVTLALLHGTCPDVLVLVHALGRTHYRAAPDVPLPALGALRRAYEEVAGLLHPARVVALAVNSVALNPTAAEREMSMLEQELAMPVADPLRGGCTRLLDAVLKSETRA